MQARTGYDIVSLRLALHRTHRNQIFALNCPHYSDFLVPGSHLWVKRCGLVPAQAPVCFAAMLAMVRTGILTEKDIMTITMVFFAACQFDIAKMREETATETGKLVRLRQSVMTAALIVTDDVEKKLCQAAGGQGFKVTSM